MHFLIEVISVSSWGKRWWNNASSTLPLPSSYFQRFFTWSFKYRREICNGTWTKSCCQTVRLFTGTTLRNWVVFCWNMFCSRALKREEVFRWFSNYQLTFSECYISFFCFERIFKSVVLKYWDISCHVHEKAKWIKLLWFYQNEILWMTRFFFVGFSFREKFSIFFNYLVKNFCKNSGLNKFIFVMEIIPSVIFQSNSN